MKVSGDGSGERDTALRPASPQPTRGSAERDALPSKKSVGRRLRLRHTLLLTVLLGCEPELVIGAWPCAGSAYGGAANASPPVTPSDPVPLPWSSGFEDGFCGFTTEGFCYTNPEASYEVVRDPVHSGTFAAAFHVAGDPTRDGLQARCAQQGVLPRSAYYGAWFYVPHAITASDNWNLFHFDGESAQVEHGLWDVSLLAEGDQLQVYVFDFMRGVTYSGLEVVPVGSWFHLEVLLVRASDASGRFELYVDGALVLSLVDVVTDDSEIGQWYVGNLAALLTPAPGTLYVDDVTIAAERQGER